jgi:hypothetical protein
MSAPVHLTSLACALGAVAFGAVAGGSARALLMAATAFAATLAWPIAATWPAATGATGLLIAVVAVARLTGWARQDVVALTAGWAAASWAMALHSEGVPLWGGALLAGAVPAFAIVQSVRRPSFAPARLCEDALVVVAFVAVCAAAAPGLADGWRAAVNLKFGEASQAAAMVPIWAIAVSLTAAGAGAAYGAWSRR